MSELNNSTVLIPSDSPLRLCYPADQPDHPCHRLTDLEILCSETGVSLGDQQKCICSGEYFNLQSSCNECFKRNGLLEDERADSSSSIYAALSTAYCELESPTQALLEVYMSVMSVSELPTGVYGYKTEGIEETPVSLSGYYTSESGGSQFTPSVMTTPSPTTTTPSESSESTPTGDSSNDNDKEDGDGDADDGGSGDGDESGSDEGEGEGEGKESGAVTLDVNAWATFAIGGMLLLAFVS